MYIERGPGRSLFQAPPGPGWAGKRPQIVEFRFFPRPQTNLKTVLTALALWCPGGLLDLHGKIPGGPPGLPAAREAPGGRPR